MSILTNAQIIEKNGKPIFAVIPYEDYLALLPEESDQTIPHEVVGLVIKKIWVYPDFPNNLVHGKCCLNNLIDENRSIGFNRCGSVRQRA